MARIKTSKTTTEQVPLPDCPVHRQEMVFNPGRACFECVVAGCRVIAALKLEDEVNFAPTVLEGMRVASIFDVLYLVHTDTNTYVKLPQCEGEIFLTESGEHAMRLSFVVGTTGHALNAVLSADKKVYNVLGDWEENKKGSK